jgi:hypothetical protein
VWELAGWSLPTSLAATGRPTASRPCNDYERLNGVRIMGDSEDMMYELTDAEEIRDYVKEMLSSE